MYNISPSLRSLWYPPGNPASRGKLLMLRSGLSRSTVLEFWGGVWVELVSLLWVEDGNILGAHHPAQKVVFLVGVNRA
jgi:hypothetical protein